MRDHLCYVDYHHFKVLTNGKTNNIPNAKHEKKLQLTNYYANSHTNTVHDFAHCVYFSCHHTNNCKNVH